MRQAFTMIEMIFVIVIIGILSAVAIPKLSATRTDAKVSAEVRSVQNALNNLGTEYSTRNAFIDYTHTDANAAVKCFTFDTDTDGNVTVSMIASENTECPSNVYITTKQLTSNSILTSAGESRVHQFGGSKIKR